MANISTSGGVDSSVPNMLVGNGRTGGTKDLDAEVQRAAELLSEAYGMDVTIRFNSDRMSGGAWLVSDQVDGIGANEVIGITVEVRDVARLKSFHETYPVDGVPGFERQLALEGQDPANPPTRYLVRSAFIDASVVAKPEMLNSGTPDSRYANVHVATLDEAIDVLACNANLPASQGSAPGL